MELARAAQIFKTTEQELQALIDSGEYAIGDVRGTIMCTYDATTKKYALQRRKQAPPPGEEKQAVRGCRHQDA